MELARAPRELARGVTKDSLVFSFVFFCFSHATRLEASPSENESEPFGSD